MYNFLNFSDEEIKSIYSYFEKQRKEKKLSRLNYVSHACKVLRVPKSKYNNYFTRVYENYIQEKKIREGGN